MSKSVYDHEESAPATRRIKPAPRSPSPDPERFHSRRGGSRESRRSDIPRDYSRRRDRYDHYDRRDCYDHRDRRDSRRDDYYRDDSRRDRRDPRDYHRGRRDDYSPSPSPDYEHHRAAERLDNRRRDRSVDSYGRTSRKAESTRAPRLSKEQPKLSKEERDRRTVFVSQLAARLRERDLGYFFEDHAGRVRDVKIVVDRKSGRSKGIGYVEFEEEAAVTGALALSGRELMGIPIKVDVSATESARRSGANEGRGDASDRRLYVGAVGRDAPDNELRALFAQHGTVEQFEHTRDPLTLRGRGFAFVQFEHRDEAVAALEALNGAEAFGRKLVVQFVHKTGDSLQPTDATGRGPAAEADIASNPMELARRELLESLEAKSGVRPAEPTRVLQLVNMFDPAAAPADPDAAAAWSRELVDDVGGECVKFGAVENVQLDSVTPGGRILVTFAQVDGAVAAQQALDGRWFDGRRVSASTC